MRPLVHLDSCRSCVRALLRLRASRASSAHGPAPTRSKKREQNNWASSERISCNTAQKPTCGGTGGGGGGGGARSRGGFVGTVATTISISSGGAGKRGAKPPKQRGPPPISTHPPK